MVLQKAKELNKTSRELLDIPGFYEKFLLARQQIERGELVDLEDIRRDVLGLNPFPRNDHCKNHSFRILRQSFAIMHLILSANGQIIFSSERESYAKR